MLVKSVILTLVVLIAVAAEQPRVCHPRSEFFQQCNKCVCNRDGTDFVCTRKMCPPGDYNEDGSLVAPIEEDVIVVDKEPETCQVGKKYKLDCNKCSCLGSGVLVCTKMRCPHPKPVKRSTVNHNGVESLPTLPEGPCEPGRSYKNDCNVCVCSEQGVPFCSLKGCFTNDVVKDSGAWGPVYNIGDRCEPGKSFYSECNQCFCARNGRSAVCTLKTCFPLTKQ